MLVIDFLFPWMLLILLELFQHSHIHLYTFINGDLGLLQSNILQEVENVNSLVQINDPAKLQQCQLSTLCSKEDNSWKFHVGKSAEKMLAGAACLAS